MTSSSIASTEPAGLVDQLDHVAAVGRVADGQRADDRVGRPDRFDDVGPGGPRGRDRGAAGGLATDEPDRPPFDQAQVGQLLEAAGDPGEHRPGGDRRDDDVGRPPAERLGDLVGEGLGALGVERPEVDVDEAPAGLVGDLEAQPVDVVVGALDRHDRGAVGERMVDLGRLEVGRDEDVGRQADRRGSRRRRAGEVAGRCAGQRLDAELERPGGRDRDGAVLERQRRVARVVLDPQLLETERRGEALGRQQGRGPDGQTARRRRIDREELGVAPDAGRACRDGLAGQ